MTKKLPPEQPRKKGGRKPEGKETKQYLELVKPNLELIKGWVRDGAPEYEVAEKLGIGKVTLYAYKRDIPELAEALKVTREVADRTVEAAMFKSATGYTYDEVHRERRIVGEDAHGKPVTEMVVVKTIRKDVAPNIGAGIWWLANRQKGKWVSRPDEKQLPADMVFNIKLPEDYPQGDDTPKED